MLVGVLAAAILALLWFFLGEPGTALYDFDEGKGDVLGDSSGKGHHGTIVGATWVNIDGSPIKAGKKNK